MDNELIESSKDEISSLVGVVAFAWFSTKDALWCTTSLAVRDVAWRIMGNAVRVSARDVSDAVEEELHE